MSIPDINIDNRPIEKTKFLGAVIDSNYRGKNIFVQWLENYPKVLAWSSKQENTLTKMLF